MPLLMETEAPPYIYGKKSVSHRTTSCFVTLGFNFCYPRLLFRPRFYLFATLGYYSALGFQLLPP